MKGKGKYVTLKALKGSLIIPPHKLKTSLNIIFQAGLDCYKLHPDDNSYDKIHLKESIKKLVASFNNKKSKFGIGGKKCSN